MATRPDAATALKPMARLAWRNVTRNWRHSLATILAIASGFIAVCLFDGFIRELEARNLDGFGTRGMLGHIVVQKHDAQQYSYEDQWLYSLDHDDQVFLDDFFAHDPAFNHRVRFLSMMGLVSAGVQNSVFIGYGYDLAEGFAVRGERWQWNTIAGRPLDAKAPAPSVLVGGGLAHLLDCEFKPASKEFILDDGNYVPADRPFTCKNPLITLSATTEAAQVNAAALPISGIIDAGFREADKRLVHISLEEAQRLLDTDKITMVGVQLKAESDTLPFISRLQTAAAAKGRHLDVMPWTEHQMAAYVRGGMQILNVFRNLFMVIVVTIGVMSVANTMMKSVNERIREIGTLRSLGFLRRELVSLFALEGFFLSVLACGIGLIATVVLAAAVGQLGITYKAGFLSTPITLKVQQVPMAWLVSAISLSVLATGTAWLCARRASQMVVADAMRHV